MPIDHDYVHANTREAIGRTFLAEQACRPRLCTYPQLRRETVRKIAFFVTRPTLTHFGDVLEGEIGIVDVLLDLGHESVRHVVLVESLDLQRGKKQKR